MTELWSHGLIVRLSWVQLCLLAVAAALLAPQAARAADDSQRLEERLPTAAKPGDEAAPAPALVPATQADLASFPEFTLRTVDIEGVTAFPKSDDWSSGARVLKACGHGDGLRVLGALVAPQGDAEADHCDPDRDGHRPVE